MASLLLAEKGGEFMKDGVSSSAQTRGRTVLQLADGEESIGNLITLLCLDREVIRQRGGVSRHLERLELAFKHQRR